MIEPIPFIKNNRTAGHGSKGGLLGGMDPIRTKVVGKQPQVKQAMPTMPIKAQVKPSNTSATKAKKGKKHMPQKSFYVDYVLTWNRYGKVVAKYVGPRTTNNSIKRSVWVPKVLVTNTLGPKPLWVPKYRA